EVASVLHAREQVFDSCPRLATRSRALLFPMVLKGRRDSVIVQAKVLSDAFSDAICVLTHVQRNRKIRGQPEPLVVEVKEHRSPAGAMEFDPPVTLRAGQERVGPRPPEGVHTAFLRKLSRPQCAPTLGGDLAELVNLDAA